MIGLKVEAIKIQALKLVNLTVELTQGGRHSKCPKLYTNLFRA